MKIIYSNVALTALALATCFSSAIAGNKDRTGQAGATELLINPWARSCGVFAQNGAYIHGLEAMKTNIAGLSFTEGLDIGASYTHYLSGSGVGILNAGLAVKLGSSNVVGVNIQSMSFGEIPVNTVDDPDQGTGLYKPQFFNIQLGYAKTFSNSIHVGAAVTFVSETITNASASGAVFEAGVQYQTGERDNFHFGITLRNIGTNMQFDGQGFAINGEAPGNSSYQQNRKTPQESFDMPTYLNIAAAYDIWLDEKHLEKKEDKPKHRLTVMGAFTSNSFQSDLLGGGLEYSFREIFSLRGSYRHQSEQTGANPSTFYTGWSAGASVGAPLGTTGTFLTVDYAFRPTQQPANGVHTFSLRFNRGNARARSSDPMANPATPAAN